eukprot:SAG22_NODE_122_length_18920_cov_23.494076_6_plen_33_part_00
MKSGDIIWFSLVVDAHYEAIRFHAAKLTLQST